MQEISATTAIHAVNTEPEVSVKITAKYLGTTERTIINYLKSGHLRGKKVGKEWFIESGSILVMRPKGSPIQQAVLPPIENPKSASQEGGGRSAKEWELVKTPKRNPMKLNAFARLKEVFDAMKNADEGFSETGYEFFRQALFEIGDDLSAGYYSFGPIKGKLYSRARIRAGRLVSRALLKGAPAGFTLVLCQLVESIAYLCRSLEKRSPMTGAPPRGPVKSSKEKEKAHGAG